ncbi:MAG TPA: hypothetical protein VFO54_09375 [Chryseosolibacter sp.]|nr:hypothetical protein [Chryseosolibacter sp.]
MKTLIAVILMAVLTFNFNTTQAQKPGVVLDNDPGWKKIGETVASFKEQDESIAVLGADEFAAIKIKVNDAPLQIERLQVFYESGDMEEIEVKKAIQKGGESAVFRLEHPDRDIQKVAFTYSTVPNEAGEKADVELYGLKSGNEGKSDAYRDDAERAEEKIEREADQAEENIEQGAERTESDVERAAEKTGDAISETAGKAAAEIDDKRHETKVGPDGQTIYISDDSRCYYIDEEGKRVYVPEWKLIDKPKDKD